jgi:hypothetical protein
MWFGIFLLALGVLYLLRNMGIIYGDIWDWIWPIALICLGVSIILKPGHFCRDRHDRKTGEDKPASV